MRVASVSGRAMAAGRKQRVTGDPDPVAARKLRTVPEYVAACRIDAVEDPVAAGEHARDLEAEAPGQGTRERPARFEQRARARRFEREERAPGLVTARFRD